mmetsp:Transcript_3321/g.12041  ORF Transcript_3321/g.12041 Transcript_3321/m.12041 type:complete len:839 (-) Transcript_3321:751-3267(-)
MSSAGSNEPVITSNPAVAPEMAAAMDEVERSAPDLKRIHSFGAAAIPEEPYGPYLRRLAVLVFFCAFPALLFGVLFTSTGFGVTVITHLVEQVGISVVLLISGVSILTLLYVCDFSYWTGPWWVVKTVLMVGAMGLVAAGAVLSAKRYPTMPLMIYLLLAPAYFAGLRRLFWRDTPPAYFLGSLAPALFLTGAVGIFWWAFDITRRDEVWPGDNCRVRCDFYNKLSCPGVLSPAQVEALQSNPAIVNGTDKCPCLWVPAGAPPVARDSDCELAAFLVWTSLFIASTAVIIFSGVIYFLSRSFLARTDSRSLNKNVRVFGTLLSLGVLGLWVATQINGADMALSNVVMAFSGAFIFAVIVVVGASIGWDSLDKELTDIPLVKTMKNSFASDYLKAFGVFLFPLYCIFVVFSLVNHFFRLHLTPCAFKQTDEDKALWVTRICHKQLVSIRNWPWTSVLTKVMLIGIFYFSFSVGVGKITYIFLSYLNSQLASLPLGGVTAIFMIIGLLMFLLPPVPGAPVYLVGGVMVTNSAWVVFSGGEGQPKTDGAFWAAGMYTVMLGFVLKFAAISVQQKGFGEQLGKKVAIRKAVGVNSITIKAIKHILTKPGLSIGKVAILVGGPDWPTSVLTGILHLSLPAMLFGSIPVLFLITPTVLAGSLMLRQADGGIYTSLGSMFLALCALVQSLGLFAAMYFIEDVSAKHRDELEAEPKDEEVLEEERKDIERKRLYDAATKWQVLPALQRANLIVGAAFTVAYCMMFGMMGSKCFESFNIVDTIEDTLGGNVLNVVKPNNLPTGEKGFGWIGLGLFALSSLQFYVFSKWAGCKVAAAQKRGGGGGGGS